MHVMPPAVIRLITINAGSDKRCPEITSPPKLLIERLWHLTLQETPTPITEKPTQWTIHLAVENCLVCGVDGVEGRGGDDLQIQANEQFEY